MTYRKRIIILSVVICILFLILVSPYIIWHFSSSRPTSFLIVDKTVPKPTYREHKALMWVLNNLKYTNKQPEKAYQFDQDYYGFFPSDNFTYSIKHLEPDPGHVDLIYLADTYGVYNEDFYKENIRGKRSHLIYGGLEQKELDIIETLLGKSTLLIGEFNTFATPTYRLTGSRLENLFGVRWSGWIGRYFQDLDKNNEEVPVWLITNYEKQYEAKWDFKGPGFGFVHIDDSVIILKHGEDVGNELIKVVFSAQAEKALKVRNNAGYYYWFDILTPKSNTEILAQYKLDVTEKGREKLEKFGIPNTFPAVVRTGSPYRTYYFAGDFSDIRKVPTFWNASFLKYLMARSYRDIASDQSFFFWNVYYPMLENILEKELKPESGKA